MIFFQGLILFSEAFDGIQSALSLLTAIPVPRICSRVWDLVPE